MFVKEANRALEEDKVKQENNIKFNLDCVYSSCIDDIMEEEKQLKVLNEPKKQDPEKPIE
jgi:hypothetical protein